MRTVHNEALKEHLGHDLAEAIVLGVLKEVQEAAAEPMGMRIWVAEVEDHRAN